MVKTWKRHCPIDKETDPVQRVAWREGWKYRTKRAPGLDREKARSNACSMIKDPDLLTAWLQGYDAADRCQMDELGEQTAAHPVGG
jgi:hypothetical protein